MYSQIDERYTDTRHGASIALFLSLGALALMAVALLITAAGSAQAGAPTNNAPGTLAWREVPPVTTQMLRDVHMVSSADGWAVGEGGTVARYNGVSWSLVPTFTDEILVDVHMLSANEGYIMGWGAPNEGGNVYRWNGSAWSHFYTTPTDPNRMDDVGPNSLWIAGLTAIYHYNGVQWTTPFTDGRNVFSIQMYDTGSGPGGWAVGANRLMAEYRNNSWSVLEPNPAPQTLYHSSFTSPIDGWAVGFTETTYILHWNGAQWSWDYTLPEASIDRLAMVSPTLGWGTSFTGKIYRFNGSSWPQEFQASAGLRNIYMLSATEGWAVGELGLMVHYSDDVTTPTPPMTSPTRTATSFSSPTATSVGASPTRTPTTGATATGVPPTQTQSVAPTSTRTGVPSTPTVTLPSATQTSTPIPTACTLTFTDVPSTHTFYAEIRCLACRGVLGGYADGTFKPQNNITRGQIAKVVSNAANFTEPVGGQTYQDVPPTQTFYEWIERLSRRGVMGGYPCGGVGEPCMPGNRPYFRPGADATRGQLSKIVSNAAQITDPVSGQFYADVPTTNPFYTEIMRLTNRGVMSGYPCGGVGEPCDTQNRPYFRWGANVTRGQASKIVANTFYPGCNTP